MGSTRTSILEILRNANSSVSVLRSSRAAWSCETGNSKQRHGEIVCAAAIAHNVNSAHQAAGVGLRCADPREKWTPIMPAWRLARILGQAQSAAAPRDGSNLMFRSRTVQITILAAGSAFALITATAGDSAHGEGNLDASYTIS